MYEKIKIIMIFEPKNVMNFEWKTKVFKKFKSFPTWRSKKASNIEKYLMKIPIIVQIGWNLKNIWQNNNKILCKIMQYECNIVVFFNQFYLFFHINYKNINHTHCHIDIYIKTIIFIYLFTSIPKKNTIFIWRSKNLVSV